MGLTVPDCIKSAVPLSIERGQQKVEKVEIHQTVRLVVIESGKILLVHERGGEFARKPAGWGLPGGGVDGKNAQELAGAILRFLPIYCNIHSDEKEKTFNDVVDFHTDIDLRVFLVGMKEGIEETGYIIRPEKRLFEKKDAPDHAVVVVGGRILGGELSVKSVETDDCRWFLLSALPAELYVSHFSFIKRSVKIMGLDHEVSKEAQNG